MNRVIKRSPGRPWGSKSKNKVTANSYKRSFTAAAKKVVGKSTNKPPGRWYVNKPKKVCLLCLCQYTENLYTSDNSSGEDEDCDDDIVLMNGLDSCNDPRDPLSEDTHPLEKSDRKDKALSTLTKQDGVKIPQKKKPSLYIRFLTIISRHVQVQTKRFKDSAVRNQLANPFCEKCTSTIKHLCKVYNEFQVAKLGLQWKLKQISDLIKVSKDSVSWKLHVTLQKSLSTQLRVVSARSVDVFRKQVSIRCLSKSATGKHVPVVLLNKHACINAVKANWRWQVAYDQMKYYLQALIVVFALAVPPKDPPPRKIFSIAGPKSKTKKVCFSDEKQRKIKMEGGSSIEAKKENVPPRVKKESGQDGEECGGDDDDHFGGGDYSPPGSGPTSPIGGANDEGGVDEEDNKNGDDSDWSANEAASGNDSDVDFTVSANTTRRWNLRRRCTRSKSQGGDDAGNGSDTEYVPGQLPPLRSSKKRSDVPESEKKFACNLCSQRFGQDRYLKSHLSQAHGFFMQYNCPKCPNLRFRRKMDLDLHRKKAHRPENYKNTMRHLGRPTACTECEKIFPSKIKMIIHRKQTHKLMTTIYTCEKCGKVVRGKTRMAFHMKTHDRPDKPFKCTKCPRSFGTDDGLKVHARIHEDRPDWVPWVRDKKKKTTVVPREGIFKCDVPDCNKTFYKRSNLTIHKSLHEKHFKCSACNVIVTSPRDFRKHLMETHETEQKNFFCLYCDKAYTLDETYNLHRKIAHPTKSTISCDVDYCEELFENTEQLRQHLKTMHLPPDVEETKVDVKFTDIYGSSGELKKQPVKEEASATEGVAPPTLEPTPPIINGSLAPADKGQQDNKKTDGGDNIFEDLLLLTPADKKKPKKDPDSEGISTAPDPARLYTCGRCDWSFSKKIHFSLHLILHTPRDERRMYQCELCDKTFSIVDSLQTHMNRIHGPRIKPYLCLVCGVRFHRKESFIPHMRVHKDKETSDTFKCDREQCEKVFQDSVNLQKHVRMAHEIERYVRKCDVCSEKFRNKMAMLAHKVEAHGMEKPHKCQAEGCEKGYFTMNELNNHVVCHAEPTFQCSMCPKKFKRRCNLDDHYLVHKQIKNHFCEYCGKAFVKKSSLSLHLDIHRGIKKYKCEHCDKAFCRKFARDCHVRVHTGERPFKCEICSQDFAQYSSLKAHVRAHEKLNNDKVKRVPFQKSIGIGRPLKSRKKKKAEGGDTRGDSTASNQEEYVPNMPTSSGILHEAMKAAFDEINMDLESDGTIKQDGVTEVQVIQHQSYNVGGGGGAGAPNVIDVANAVSAVAALEQIEPKDEDKSSEDEEEIPVKKRRGRKPKPKAAKQLSCGFCGKTFQRENFYNMHVERHMRDVEAETIHSGGDASQQSHHSSVSVMDDGSHHSLQQVFHEDPQSMLRRKSLAFEQSPVMMNSPPVNVHPVPHNQIPTPPPPPVSHQPLLLQPKKRGRPPKQNTTPGSRLARIVEDVLEAATNRPGSVVAHQQHQQTQHYSHQPPQQQLNIPQVHHSQSPHSSIVHSESERSTPTGSPAPIQQQQQHHLQHTQQQQQHQTVATTSASSVSSLPFTSSTASFLSPFLFSNPYLIPRGSDQQQQDPMFAGFPHRQQPQQNVFPPQTLHPPQPQTNVSVNYPQQQFHQPPILAPSASQTQGSARTMPQDLSKNNYTMFYNNQR